MTSIRECYRARASRGVGRVRATLGLPVAAWRKARRRFGKGKTRGVAQVVHGLGLHDRPLLATYSRSGTNWVRYIVETISGSPTPGKTRVVEGEDYVLDRAHRAFGVMDSYDEVLMILRDYRECLLRHHEAAWPRYRTVEDFLTDESLRHPPSWYIENLRAFDRFEGSKLLLYYEDLVLRPEPAIVALAEFLGLDPGETRRFLERLEHHERSSVASYERAGHDSYSALDKDLQFHARSKLEPEQVRAFDRFYFERYPRLADRYLRHYDTRRRSVAT